MKADQKKNTENAQGLYDLGVSHLNNKNVLKAISNFEGALSLDPNFDKAYAALGKIFMDSGQFMKAVGCFAMAVKANPREISHKRKFANISQLLQVQQPNEDLKAVVLECLKTPGVDSFYLSALWCSLMVQEPPFKALFDVSSTLDYAAFKKTFNDLKDHSFFTSEFFLTSLKTINAHNRTFENVFTNLRRLILDDPKKDYVQIAEALSHYCLYTDYVFIVSDEEKQKVEQLKAKTDKASLAILACYEPLYRLSNRDAIAKQFAKSDFIKAQITEPLERAEIAQSIPALTPIEDETSRAVQAQYESAPYPCWRGFSMETRHKDYEGVEVGDEILIAGCGTGQDAIEMAARYPKAKVTAVDLSLTSLAYAIQKAKQFGIKNIKFGQADILKLGAINKTFDFIVSNGVLHHMKDPLAGWAVLESLLKPGGRMRICLYSKQGRKEAITARQWIKDNNFGSDDDSIRRFRADVDKIMDAENLNLLLHSRDFYYLPEARDFLFHVMEHNIDLNELDATIKKNKLEFLGFYLQNMVINKYRTRNPLDWKARNLKNWAKFEAKNPEVFASMYCFWVEKPV